jgi:hypothetical protein
MTGERVDWGSQLLPINTTLLDFNNEALLMLTLQQ